ncbi:putative aminopeptidase SgcX [Mesorhizobium sp. L-8-10]|uniref:M42 family metallopeptidase n=1 Tax=unclassified Mesorhizobium TaxID=325217 RepID=UPI0019252DC5|nr:MULTISPECIES: M42 family metallopeptidase [unclassified Mesorhizobium]BCH23254.1 putative aminopeptidase SgcX [Mesorhizobium sp. L-8-3]BCH31036.1 putative aminopeptidase SgcX [Mesorhizobium sp. L-8-10]
MKDRLRKLLCELMMIPGLSGHEGRVRRYLKERLEELGLATRTDMLGNLIATIDGDPALPSVMLFTHMDQLGFVVRKIEPDGFIRLERLGGVPERALASQAVLLCVGEGRDRPGIIASKSHHATTPEEKYKVVPYMDLYVDAGFGSAAEARAAGIDIGTPVVYRPTVIELGGDRIAGTAADDRAGCAVLVEATHAIAEAKAGPRVHIVFSVQEEFNLRGALTAAQVLMPEIAIQLDLILATDTPDMGYRGEVRLGGGPAMSLYSFHGRGTLNGTIPHPALVTLFEGAAGGLGLPLQRSAHTGALTDSAYVQLVGGGVASIDLGFPMRYTHSSLELCDLADLEGLTRLLAAGIGAIDATFSLDRDDHIG